MDINQKVAEILRTAGSGGSSGNGETAASLPQPVENRLAGAQSDGGVVTYPSGAKRTALAARYDLIPPLGIERVAEVMGLGADRYGDGNWQKGMPVNDVLNHALAHVFKHLRGDQTEDHLGHAACNLLMAIDLSQRGS